MTDKSIDEIIDIANQHAIDFAQWLEDLPESEKETYWDYNYTQLLYIYNDSKT